MIKVFGASLPEKTLKMLLLVSFCQCDFFDFLKINSSQIVRECLSRIERNLHYNKVPLVLLIR